KTAALKSRDPRRSRLHFASIPRSSAEQIWSRRLVKSRRLRSYAPHATTCRQLMTSLRRLVPSANALFVFEAAARYLSFTQAAGELSVTQSAVSRMIARFEAHLGAKLFHRAPTGIELTEEGRQLYAAVTSSFQRVEMAIEDIRTQHGEQGTV